MGIPGFTAETALLGPSNRYRGSYAPLPASTGRVLPAQNWGSFRPEDCTAPGLRQYSAILWDIPWGQSWEAACSTTPGSPAGIAARPPDRCVNTDLNMWGQWDVPD